MNDAGTVRPPAHMPALDGLRGLAILLVLCCHGDLFWGAGRTTGSLLHKCMAAGWVGVDLFFLLSGFLITGILLSTKASANYLKSFYARRVLRIFPLYYLFVIAMIVLRHSWYLRGAKASLLFYYYNLYAVALGRHAPWVNSLWSLAVEEQFYLVWPFLVLLLDKKHLKAVCGLGIVVALGMRLAILPHSTQIQSAYYLTFCRMDELLAGALIAIWRTDEVFWKKVRQNSPRFAWAAMACVLFIAVWSGHFSDWRLVHDFGYRRSSFLQVGPGMCFLAVIFGTGVIQCTTQNKVSRFFLATPLRTLGKYSYGIYMLHWPMLELLDRVRSRMHLPLGGIRALAYYAIFLSTTLLAAMITHAYLERPFLRLKRFFPAI